MMRRSACSINCVAVALSAVALTAPAQAIILYVDDSAPLGGSGLSWDSPMRFLQDALAQAKQPFPLVGEIRLGPGIHRPDESAAFPQGSGDRTASFHVSAELTGGLYFTLSGGYAGYGAANPDDQKPGVYLSILDGDLAENDGPGFTDNQENSYHILDVTGFPEIEGVMIRGGNANGPQPADTRGGGVTINGGYPRFRDCVFAGNAALTDGGGVSDVGAEATFRNCLFAGNSAMRGGGINNEDTDDQVILFNCTVVNNNAIVGSGVRTFGPATKLHNCVVWGNTGGTMIEGPFTAIHCDITGGAPGAGNFSADPMFVSPATGDFHLRAGSPCVDAGSNDDGTGGLGAAWDIDGQVRFAQDPTAVDCPQPGADCGEGPIIDLGPYERPSPGLMAFKGDSSLEGGWYAFGDVHIHGPMTPILSGAPLLSYITSMATSDGPLSFTFPHQVRMSPGSILFWGDWSHGGPIGEEMYYVQTIDDIVTYTLPEGTAAFDFYMESEIFGYSLFPMTVTASNGSIITFMNLTPGAGLPDGGADHVGFYTTSSDVTLTEVAIHAPYGYAVAEFRYATAQPADLSSDGIVNGFDLALLLGAWGSCPTRDATCPADLDGNDVVNGFDLAMLLSAWG